jgi:hypothetical protein
VTSSVGRATGQDDPEVGKRERERDQQKNVRRKLCRTHRNRESSDICRNRTVI